MGFFKQAREFNKSIKALGIIIQSENNKYIVLLNRLLKDFPTDTRLKARERFLRNAEGGICPRTNLIAVISELIVEETMKDEYND